jgi:hypothetical protein
MMRGIIVRPLESPCSRNQDIDTVWQRKAEAKNIPAEIKNLPAIPPFSSDQKIGIEE